MVSAPIIYQLFVGRNSFANPKNHAGRVFARLTQVDWRNLQGFNMAYLLGVWDNTSEIVVNEEGGKPLDHLPDRVPSAFAITNHTVPNPILGTLDELKTLIAQLHSCGLKVLVDLVVNQTSRQHIWFTHNPEYYKRKEDDTEAGFSGDVVMLDLNNAELLAEFKQVLERMIELGIDGVRADMAHLAPLPFWAELIREVKNKKPDFIFLAEAYSDSVFNWTIFESLKQAGFDNVYHEFLYRNLKGQCEWNQPLDFIADHLNYFLSRADKEMYVHYLRNHDDPSPLPESFKVDGWLMLLTMLPGGSLTFMGMLNGKRERLGHHYLELLPERLDELTTVPPWWTSWVNVAKVLKPQITRFWHEQGLLHAEVNLNETSIGRFVANMNHETVKLVGFEKTSEGLLRGVDSNGELGPGQGELFLVF